MLRGQGTLALWAGLMLAPACSGRPRTAGLDPPHSNSEAAPPSGRDACGLISKMEVDSILGSELTPVAAGVGSARSTCRYVSKGGGEFGLTVFWNGGRAEWQAIRAGLLLGKRAPGGGGDPEVNVGSLTSLVPEPNLGDAAWASDLLGGYVLRGEALLVFSFDRGQLPGNWAALARRALEGLNQSTNPPP